MADTPDLGSGAARLGGSSPPSRILLVILTLIIFATAWVSGCSSTLPSKDAPSPQKNREQFLQTQNEKTENYFRPLDRLVNEIFKEILGAKPKNPETVPLVVKDYKYWLTQDVGERYPQLVRSQANGPTEKVLDQNALALAYPNTTLSFLRISPDNRCVAYGLQPIESAGVGIWIKEIDSTTEAPIASYHGVDAQWGTSCDDLYFIRRDNVGVERLYRRSSSKNVATEMLQTNDPKKSLLLKKSESGQFLFANIFSFGTDDMYALDLNVPGNSFSQIQRRIPGVQYSVSHFANGFLITTSKKLSHLSLDGKSIRDIVPESNQVFESVRVYSKFAAVISRSPPIPQILTVKAADFSVQTLQPLDTMGTITFSPQGDFEGDELNFRAETLTSPPQTKPQKLSGPELNFAMSFDGTKVPLSILGQRKALPFLLHGYGAYGISAEEKYAPEIQSLVSRGFGYAICHGRGGGEMGDTWHKQGSGALRHKAEEDFLACAHYLIDKGYAARDKLFASGRSAGAFLALSAAQREPNLFAGMILEAPLIDPSNASSPINLKDVDEWGSAALLEPTQLNSLYIFTGFKDPLTPIQPIADWFAKSNHTEGSKLLLHTSDTATHSGEPDFHDAMRDRARQIAFLVERAGYPAQ